MKKKTLHKIRYLRLRRRAKSCYACAVIFCLNFPPFFFFFGFLLRTLCLQKMKTPPFSMLIALNWQRTSRLLTIAVRFSSVSQSASQPCVAAAAAPHMRCCVFKCASCCVHHHILVPFMVHAQSLGRVFVVCLSLEFLLKLFIVSRCGVLKLQLSASSCSKFQR